jgi:shikimate kinase
MMGAGKSSVGKALAALSGRPFVDTDQLLQARFGRPVSQIFRVYGEEAFRAHETSVLRSLEPFPSILATGGGIVTREANWGEMRRLGVTIYLEVDQRVLVERLTLSKKRRPLLEVEDWEGRVDELLQKRMPLYEQADLRVPVDHLDIEGVAQRVYERVVEWESAHP